MITKTAWKNIWRNKVRSFVVISSVAIGIFAGAFSVAIMEGAMMQRINDALNDELAHIQLTNRDFRSNNDMDRYIGNSGEVNKKLMSLSEVAAVSDNKVVIGMANSATKSSGVQINGVDPEQEKLVLELYKKVMPGSGTYLDNSEHSNPVFIGEDLAKTLNLIKYNVTQSVLDSLGYEGVPADILAKLEPLSGRRFNNEKSFTHELRSIFSKEEETKYGHAIRELSKTYREGFLTRITIRPVQYSG